MPDVPGLDDVKKEATSNVAPGVVGGLGVVLGSSVLGPVLGPVAGGTVAGASIGGTKGDIVTISAMMDGIGALAAPTPQTTASSRGRM
jgi:hypothetical protein